MKDKDIVKKIFEIEDIVIYNKWFFTSDWKSIEIEQFENDDILLIWENGIWKNGNWRNGTWRNGTWENGIWHDGIWQNGEWYNGTWKYGWWLDGKWKGGIWENGKIYNSKTNLYKISKISPDKCTWSLSYEG